jgi:D-glycero-beta-D-manno-heptose-7-phosphate kinase
MTTKEIQDVFEKFKSLKTLVIGDVMVDSYLWGKVERISPEAPVPIVSVTRRENRLGGAANVALNLQALGATPILCSVIGEDSKAETFIELLQQQNLTEKGIVKSADRITTTKFRVIGNHSQMLRVDEEIEHDLSIAETEKFIHKIAQLIENEDIDVIIFEDYDKGVITPALISKVTEIARKKAIPVTVDPKKKNFKHYRDVSLFKPNLKELKDGLKLDFSPENLKDFENAVDAIHQKNNIDNIMVTLSESGVYISEKEKNTQNILSRQIIPAHVRNISDVSGAGDTVISVASLCMALKLDLFTVATLSNLAGGLVCEEVGVVPVNKEKLLKEALALLK